MEGFKENIRDTYIVDHGLADKLKGGMQNGKTGRLVLESEKLIAVVWFMFPTNQTAFFMQLDSFKKDISAVSDSSVNSVFCPFWFGVANLSFFRLLESGQPQCSWLTPELFSGFFDGIRLEHVAENSAERVKTEWNMLAVISALVHYRDQQKVLPESIEQLRLSDRLLVDGWGRPLVYCVKDQKWFLKSKGADGTDGQIDFGRLGDIKTWKDLCFEGRSALHWKLYKTGVFRCHGAE
jgi:hypothetical protein